MDRKAEQRTSAREKLRALSAGELAEKSRRICENILRSALWRDSRVVCLFAAQPMEPDLALLWKNRGDRTICYPRINGTELDLIAVEDFATLQTSRWQLREPLHDENRILPIERLELILVPGLAFTRGGVRLGRGGGFYDRLLARPALRAKTIGVCFDTQIEPDLPKEVHDRSVDLLVTETVALP